MTRKSRTTGARPDTPPGYELTAWPCLRTLRLTLVFSGGPHFSSCADFSEPTPFGKVLLGAASKGPRLLLVESSDNEQTIVDPKDAAQSVGLRYVSDARPGIRRRKTGTGFSYARADGSKLS